MPLLDAHAFLLAGFSEHDVQDVLDDLDYLHQNSTWPYRKDRTTDMLTDSPGILLEFLRAVRPDALRSAMIPKKVKNMVAAGLTK
jgi:hypothetical protein